MRVNRAYRAKTPWRRRFARKFRAKKSAGRHCTFVFSRRTLNGCMAQVAIAERPAVDAKGPGQCLAETATDPVSEKRPHQCLLVAVSGSPRAGRLVLRAAELVVGTSRWFAVHLETATDARMDPNEHAALARNLSLAEQLGAETAILPAVDPVGELLNFARRHGVTQIITGRPRHSWWRNMWIGRLSVDALTRRSGEIDVRILGESTAEPGASRPASGPDRRQLLAYIWAVAVMGVATLVNAWLVKPYLPLRNVVMIYLLGVIVTAVRFGRGPSALATVVSVIAFDFAFVNPTGALGGSTPPDIITFCVMLAVGFTIS